MDCISLMHAHPHARTHAQIIIIMGLINHTPTGSLVLMMYYSFSDF
jgi:hypothetical protein